MNLRDRGELASRYLKSLAVGSGIPVHAQAYALSQGWNDVAAELKAAVSTMTPSGDGWLATNPIAADFVHFVRPLTLLGRLTGLRRAPARVRVVSATSGATAYWSGAGNARPIAKMTLSGGTALEPLRITAIVAATEELLRSSAPQAESILQRDLAAANVQAADEAFIDPANAGEAGVKPTAVTSGATSQAATGSDLASVDADLGWLIEALSDAGSDMQFATFVMRPETALYLSRLRGSGGALAYPGMSVKGGMLLGLPCLTTTGVPRTQGSPASNGSIVLLDPSQILVVEDDSQADFATARMTALQMTDDASGAGAAAMVSMLQTETVALRTTRYLNWQTVRDNMAPYVSDVPY